MHAAWSSGPLHRASMKPMRGLLQLKVGPQQVRCPVDYMGQILSLRNTPTATSCRFHD